MSIRRAAVTTVPTDPLLHGGDRALAAGDLAGAAAAYRVTVATDPRHAAAWHRLGVVTAKRGDPAGALDCLDRAVAARPHFGEAHALRCHLLLMLGRTAEAVAAGRLGAMHQPKVADAHATLGDALDRHGDPEGALRAYRKALRLDPLQGDVYAKVAALAGRTPDGLASAFSKGRLVRELVDTHLGGAALAQLQRNARLESGAAAASLNVRLAQIFVQLDRLEEAVAALKTAIAIDGGTADAHNRLGDIHFSQGQLREAFEAYRLSVERDPAFVEGYRNLSAVLILINQVEAAASAARLAITFSPHYAEAHYYLAVALQQQGRTAEAIATYRRAIALKPPFGQAVVELCALRRKLCDWDGLADDQRIALAESYRRGRKVAPFSVLTACGSPTEQQLAARVWVADMAKLEAPLAPYGAPPGEPTRRLRVGYVSADFCNHATAMLIAELFEHHDRTRFELFGYSLGVDDGSALRRRIVDALDHFTDVWELSHFEAARRIRADDIDILIDLKGHTKDARAEIFAYRPAPIQVSFLGYPGTMGASFIDYIVADNVVIPPEHHGHFDEHVVTLPHSYQPNDRQRAIAALLPTRAECGLPERGFVFCCFNNNYKITPALFDVWMRLLQGTEGAVLWLFVAAEEAVANLRREAEARGVAADRLVFAPKVSAEQHISRMGVADLFLDTLPVNAHTTASEALWAGLPVLTCLGEAFAGRVAASLLEAVGLPDLVTGSLEAYEAKALTLAADPARLRALRERLRANRLTHPLYDTPRYARNFEAALTRMTELRRAGEPPQAFSVADQG